jgi:hypothetical protein
MDGDDLRDLPLSMRKASLAGLPHRRPDGIFQISHEQGEICPGFGMPAGWGWRGWFQRSDRPYRGGRSKDGDGSVSTLKPKLTAELFAGNAQIVGVRFSRTLISDDIESNFLTILQSR